jgi:RNA polymerase sigma-70 factor (ECF subfamily)
MSAAASVVGRRESTSHGRSEPLGQPVDVEYACRSTTMNQEPDDFALLDRWKAGDGAAGDQLVRRHYMSVRRFFEARFSAFADDLTQRTFLACVETLPERPVRESFRACLFGIARNQLLMQLRKSRQRSAVEYRRDMALRPTPRTSVTGLLARNEEHHYVLRALVQLPPDLQVAMQLFYWELMSTDEIGRVIEVPASTVRSRLARARELMAKSITRLKLPKPLQESLAADLEEWTRTVAVAGDASHARAPVRSRQRPGTDDDDSL